MVYIKAPHVRLKCDFKIADLLSLLFLNTEIKNTDTSLHIKITTLKAN